MDSDVLSFTKSDAVERPGSSLRQVIPKIHEDQLFSKIKLAIKAQEPNNGTDAMELHLKEGSR